MNQKLLDVLRQTPQMTVQQIGLSTLAPDWAIENDILKKPDGKFFSVIGARMTSGGGLEVREWKQPFIAEKGGEVVLAAYDGQFLIRPKQEPGNPSDFNFAMWAAGFQASEGNKSQAHQGTAPLYTNIEDLGSIILETKQPKDGNRFLGKINSLKILELDDEPQLIGGARLVSERELAELVLAGPNGITAANEHLVETFAQYQAAKILGLI